MMERAGFTRTVTSQETRTWFEDDRYTTQKQADYLTKLRRLRSELINQESSNLSNALGRMNPQPEKEKKQKGGRRNPILDSGPDSFPTRHVRLMNEKRQRILNHRVRKASPKLETIEGKQLVDPGVKDDASVTSKSRSEGDELISRDLLRRIHKEKDIAPVFRKLLQPTHSIPNIGTRAIKRSDKELHLDSDRKPDILDSSCVKPLNIPRRGLNAPKDYKLRGLLDGSKDEMAVNPAALQYLNYEYDERSGGYYVPASSPVEGVTAEDAELVNGSSDTPFRLEKIHMADSPIPMQLSYKKPKTRAKVITDQSTSLVYKTSPEFDESSDSKLPEIHTKQLQKAERQLSDFRVENSAAKKQIVVEMPDFRVENSAAKKQIVVEMPNIMFMPSTPDPSIASSESYLRQGPLTKAVSQNKIREREIKNLLQDVKDLNQITEQLEQKAKDEEANR